MSDSFDSELKRAKNIQMRVKKDIEKRNSLDDQGKPCSLVKFITYVKLGRRTNKRSI
jgi:hypothetical protein